MAGAFQSNAFQNNAFQIGGGSVVTAFSGLSKAPGRGLSKITMIDTVTPTYRATTQDTKADTVSSITYLVDGLPI